MRLLANAFHDRLPWEEADAACHWKDLVIEKLGAGSQAIAGANLSASRRDRLTNRTCEYL